MPRFIPPDGLELEHCDVREGYRRWSETYDEMLTDTADGPILRRFLPLLGDIDGCRVLDHGCGTGRNVAWLREHDIAVRATGVDLCPEMLARAAPKGLYERLVEGDHPALGERFDLALSILTACHIEDLAGHYAWLHEALEPDGHLLLIDMHPHMFHIGKGTYVPTGDGDRTYSIANHLHELSDHTRCALGAGFSLEALEESFVPPEWAARSPTYDGLDHHPLAIGFCWHR